MSPIKEIFKTLRNIMESIRNGERIGSWEEKLNIIKIIVFPNIISALGVAPVVSDKGVS